MTTTKDELPNPYCRIEINADFHFLIFSDEPITEPSLRRNSYLDTDYHGEVKDTLFQLLTHIDNTKIERINDFSVIFVREKANEIRIYLDHTEEHDDTITVVYRSKKQIRLLANAILKRWFS